MKTLISNLALTASVLLISSSFALSCKNSSKSETVLSTPSDVAKPKENEKTQADMYVDSPVKPKSAELKVEAETYKVYVEAPKNMNIGEESAVSFFIEPAEGWKMNKEFPSKIKVEAVDGIELSELDGHMIVESAASFPSQLKATKALETEVEFELRFAVCTEATCDPKLEKIKIPVVAKAGNP